MMARSPPSNVGRHHRAKRHDPPSPRNPLNGIPVLASRWHELSSKLLQLQKPVRQCGPRFSGLRAMTSLRRGPLNLPIASGYVKCLGPVVRSAAECNDILNVTRSGRHVLVGGPSVSNPPGRQGRYILIGGSGRCNAHAGKWRGLAGTPYRARSFRQRCRRPAAVPGRVEPTRADLTHPRRPLMGNEDRRYCTTTRTTTTFYYLKIRARFIMTAWSQSC